MENIKELVNEYRDIREDLSVARKLFKAKEDECKEQMDVLEIKLLNISNESGVDSFKTQYGTCFRTTKTYARLGAGEESKQARIDWAIENNDFGLFTSHVNKTHTKELIDDGVNPADFGIDWIEEAAFQFRK